MPDERRRLQVLSLWALLVCIVLVRFTIQPGRNVGAYREASLRWRAGEPLYDTTGAGFLYAPHAALLYCPFSLPPQPLGDGLWRLVNLAVFAWGTWRLSRVALSGPAPSLLVHALAASVALNSAINGQFNLVMTGLLMLAASSIARRQWWLASGLLVLGVAFKPHALVLLFLVAPLYPALLGRLLVVATLSAALPFLAQEPAYVAQQFRDFLDCLRFSSAQGDRQPFAHLFTTAAFFGADVPAAGRTAVRVLAAGGTFLLCVRAKARLDPARAALLLFSFAATFVTVFNPRTESCTYSILGPVLGIHVVLAVENRTGVQRRLAVTLACAIAFVLVANYELGKHLAPATPAVLFSPILGGCLFAWLCVQALRASPVAEPANVPGGLEVLSFSPGFSPQRSAA